MPPYTTEPAENGGRRQVILAAVFLGLAVIAGYLPSSQQRWLAGVLHATVLRPFVATQEAVARARARAQDVTLLQAQLDSIVAAQVRLSALEDENRRLRALLELPGLEGVAFVPASVLRPSTAGSESMFVLDAGSHRGVRENTPVIMREGLVGVVRETHARMSIGMDWTHPDFRASAMAEDGETYGMVESRRGGFREEDRLLLVGTPFHAHLEPGTRIVTSGLGGVFPRGIPIGSVEGPAGEEAGWQRSYWLRPAVHPGDVTHVIVLLPRGLGDLDGLESLWSGEGGGGPRASKGDSAALWPGTPPPTPSRTPLEALPSPAGPPETAAPVVEPDVPAPDTVDPATRPPLWQEEGGGR